MTDTIRPIGTGREAVAKTRAATITYLDFIEKWALETLIEFDIPNFKTNKRWEQSRAIPKTRTARLTLEGRVDTTEIGWILLSALGIPTSASSVHTFLGGVNAGGATTDTLSFALLEGLSNLWWNLLGARVNKFHAALNAADGGFKWTAEVLGIDSDALTSPPTPTYSLPADTSPMAPWDTVLTLGGVGLCLNTFEFDIDNHLEPYYCTPTSAPGAGAEVGLRPNRYTQGPITGTFKLGYEYTADAASAYYDYRHNVAEVWRILAADAASGHSVQFDLPNAMPTKGQLDRDKPNVMQMIEGSILYDASTGSGFKAILTNGQSAYAAS